MGVSRVDGDLIVSGQLSAQNMSLPASSVGDTQFKSADPLTAAKQQHQHRANYAQESGTTSATEARVMHVVKGATGSVVQFEAGSVTVCVGAATIVVDLLNNGVSILSAPITLDSGNSVRVAEAGTIASAAVVDGDVLDFDALLAG